MVDVFAGVWGCLVVGFVLLAFVGGGLWLYLLLDSFVWIYGFGVLIALEFGGLCGGFCWLRNDCFAYVGYIVCGAVCLLLVALLYGCVYACFFRFVNSVVMMLCISMLFALYVAVLVRALVAVLLLVYFVNDVYWC